VLPIWEGTTNVLALDLLRAAAEVGGIAPLASLASRCRAACSEPRIVEAAVLAETTVKRVIEWYGQRSSRDTAEALQSGGRRLSLVLGGAVALALLCEHAQWAFDTENDERPADVAARLAARGFGRLYDPPREATRRLGLDEAQ